MTLKRTLFALLAAVALVQSAALLKMVYDRHTLIKTGREIAIPVVPVDPRDLMRGDYVTLGYPISPLRRSALPGGDRVAKLNSGAAIYVTLSPESAGGWKPVALAATYPPDVTQGDVVIKGRVQYNYGGDAANTGANDNLAVRYGIESYFVPEGTGKPIELSIRDRQVAAIVAVGPDGTAALKGLVIGDERHEDPPIF